MEPTSTPAPDVAPEAKIIPQDVPPTPQPPKKLSKLKFNQPIWKKPSTLIFVFLFALVGGVLIFRSFAASSVGQVEAEALTGSGMVVTDSTASGSKALKLTNEVAAVGNIDASASGTTVTISARGTNCSGDPQAQINLDGKQVLLANVSGAKWTTYTAAVTVSQGSHSISAALANPFSETAKGKSQQHAGCDRELYIDYFQIEDTSTAPTPTPTPTPAPTPAPTTPGGVPIPKTGLYWGGSSSLTKADIATVAGCTGFGWPNIDCKINWAAGQLGILAGHTQSDGKYHSSLDHFFFTSCGSTATNAFSPGGSVYVSAHTPGRKVILVDLKCGSKWSDLGSGGGTTTYDTQLKSFTRLADSLGIPVIISIYNEPENDICGLNSAQGTPDDFRAMFRQAVADIRGQQPKSISIALTLQGYDLNYQASHAKVNPAVYDALFTSCSQANLTDAERNPNNFYPGDDVVDFLTFQEYDHDTGDWANRYQLYQNWMARPCPSSHPSTNYNCSSAVRSQKPMGSSEWGVSGCTAFRETYFNGMTTELPKFPQIKYLAYWNNQDNPKFADFIDYPYQTPDPTVASHTDCGTDTTHASLKAFTKLTLSPYVYAPSF